MQLKTGRKAWKISKTKISQTVRNPISQCENFANCSQTSFALRNPNPQYTVALRKLSFAKFRIAKIRNEFANQIRNANFAKPISQCQMQFRNAKIFAIPNSQCENFAMRKFRNAKIRNAKISQSQFRNANFNFAMPKHCSFVSTYAKFRIAKFTAHFANFANPFRIAKFTAKICRPCHPL